MKAPICIPSHKRKIKAGKSLSSRILSADHPFSTRKSWREEMCPMLEKAIIRERF